MALKECRECNQKVSTNAENCPHCGIHQPILGSLTPKQRENRRKLDDRIKHEDIIVKIILAIIVIWVIFKFL
jgi:hypothetical protein